MADDKKSEKGEKAEKPAAAAAPAGDKPKSDKAKGKRKEKAPATITAAPGKAAAKGEKPARLRAIYKDAVIPSLMKEFGLQEPDAGPQAGEDRRQHGSRRGDQQQQADRAGRGAADGHHRPEAGGDPPRKSIANFKLRESQPIGAWSRCAATACTSSSTAWSPSRCPASATSRACRPRPSTARATTR